jgi:hypothetical protein
MTIQEYAEKYHLTTNEIRREHYNFIQNEGYLSDGTECITFDAWMRCRNTNNIVLEPFQKSDLDYGL